MFKGIKPTRFWHRTPRKYFWKLIHDRINTRPRFEQRGKRDKLQILAIVLAAISTVGYSYGMFSPKQDMTTIRPPGSCDGVRRRCPNMPPCGFDDSRRR